MVDGGLTPNRPPALDFDDFVGFEDVKSTLRDVFSGATTADSDGDSRTPRGVLLSGAPGTGKTFLARALAGEFEYDLLSVGPAEFAGSDRPVERVRSLFAIGRENSPCLLFVDEVDSLLGGERGDRVVETMLAELSEDHAPRLVCATNVETAAVMALSDADETVRVQLRPPNRAERTAILQSHLDERPTDMDDVEWESLVEATDGYTPADLERVAATAARKALRDTRARESEVGITESHVAEAVADTDPQVGDVDRWY